MSYTSPSVIASGITFAQLQAGGPSGHLNKLITANTANTSAPSAAPTLAASGSLATLPAATYFVQVTETNGIGETTPSPVSSGQVVTFGQNLVVTPPALQSGNTARYVYVGTASGGPFTLAVTGTSTSTVTISAPLPSNSYAVNPPTSNTTGLTNAKLQLLKYCETGQFEKVWNFIHQVETNFNQGEPAAFNSVVTKFRDVHTAFAMMATMCAEAGALLDANPGHLTTAATPIGGRASVRVWP